MIRHTPGPWFVFDDEIVSDRSDVHIATVGLDDGIDPMAWQANLRLIAAAPDLLAALKALRIDANRLCDRMLGGSYEDDCRLAISVADAAIAKAEGR